MTAYNFQGLLVDVKGYNWHMSAPLYSVPGATHATAGTATIDAGAVVMEGTTAGTIMNATGSVASALGVMNETRAYSASDKRVATYTWAGIVRIKLAGTITAVGEHITSAAKGEVVTVNDTVLAEHVLAFGKALETGVDGDIIMAYVNFAH